jgi:hypothetical protein
VSDPAERGRQRISLDELRLEPVLLQRCDVSPHIPGLLLGGGEAQRAYRAHRVAHPERLRQRVYLLLDLDGAGVDPRRRLASPALARIHVEGGRTRKQEAAVATARAGRHRARLEQHGFRAALRQLARTRQPAHPAADHAGVHLDVAAKRRAGLVGVVEPVGDRVHAPVSTTRAG